MNDVCKLCEKEPPQLGKELCSACRSDQRHRMLLEAAGGGASFAALAILLYLLGRWFAG